MPRISKGLLFLLLFSMVVGVSGRVFAQDPQGTLDYYYIQCGTDTVGGVKIQAKYHSDNTGFNRIQAFGFPVLITVSNNALVQLDTTVATTFAGSGVSGFVLKITGTSSTGGADPTVSPVHFIVGAVNFTGGVTGDSLFCTMKITLKDSCTITIDTLGDPPSNYEMATEGAQGFRPGWGDSTLAGGYPPGTGAVCVITAVRDIERGTTAELPTAFSLNQNFPNPFNATTVIQFALPQASHVKLEIFNVLGQRIRVLVDEDLEVGYKQVVWDGRDQSGNPVASGIYFYRLNARDLFTDMKKMLLIK